MRPIATDVARSVVCVFVRWSHGCAVQKRVNRSRCRLGADSRGFKKPCIRWGQDRTNPFAATRVTSRRCGLLSNYLGHVFTCSWTDIIPWPRTTTDALHVSVTLPVAVHSRTNEEPVSVTLGSLEMTIPLPTVHL